MSSDCRMFTVLGEQGFVTYTESGDATSDMNDWQITTGTGCCICIGPEVSCGEAFRTASSRKSFWNEAAQNLTCKLNHQVERLKRTTSFYSYGGYTWRLWWGLGIAGWVENRRIDTDDN